MDKAYIRDLAQKYVEGRASNKELDILHKWYDEQLTEEEEVVVTSFAESPEGLKERMYTKILEDTGINNRAGAVVRPMRSVFKRYWAAAAVVSGLLIGGYFFFLNPTDPKGNLTVEQRFKNDLAPGGNKAILTLSNGQKIVLDSLANGWIVAEGGATIEKTADGLLLYKPGTGGMANAIHTISTPVGGEFAVELPDGSKVWLNALSSLKFAATFSGNERLVQLSGEAYFEVAKNAAKPFIVEVGTAGTQGYQRVEVLGTHFNIKAYPDEVVKATTLIEGKVKVSSLTTDNILAPGQQMVIGTDGKASLNENADVDVLLAWHKGLFRFKDLTLREIMPVAARWYGIEVVYEGDADEHFSSGIPRQSTLQEFLKILEATGRVKFLIEGNKVTVLSE